MEAFHGFIVFVVAVPIAVFYFLLLHKIFDIYYFGCSGMVPVIVGCFVAAFFTASILVGIGFFLLILVAIAIVGYIIYAAATGQLSSDSTEAKPGEGESNDPEGTSDQPAEADGTADQNAASAPVETAEAGEAPDAPAGEIVPQPNE